MVNPVLRMLFVPSNVTQGILQVFDAHTKVLRHEVFVFSYSVLRANEHFRHLGVRQADQYQHADTYLPFREPSALQFIHYTRETQVTNETKLLIVIPV